MVDITNPNIIILYYRKRDGKLIILLVYVDDIMITGDYEEGIAELKKYLNSEFHIKDLRALKYFLGMEIARSKSCICQRK